VVVSLGGGTPCFHNNIDIINTNGISVYLQVDTDTLTKRLSKEKSKRPLIRNLNESELKHFIETNLEKRSAVYKKAHLTINTTLLSEDELIKEIIRRVMNK
jgi:shikimate kinase